jgi:hypothetical protein
MATLPMTGFVMTPNGIASSKGLPRQSQVCHLSYPAPHHAHDQSVWGKYVFEVILLELVSTTCRAASSSAGRFDQVAQWRQHCPVTQSPKQAIRDFACTELGAFLCCLFISISSLSCSSRRITRQRGDVGSRRVRRQVSYPFSPQTTC